MGAEEMERLAEPASGFRAPDTPFAEGAFLRLLSSYARGRLTYLRFARLGVMVPAFTSRLPYPSLSSLPYGFHGGPHYVPGAGTAEGNAALEALGSRFARAEVVDFSGTLSPRGYEVIPVRYHWREALDAPERRFNENRRRALAKGRAGLTLETGYASDVPAAFVLHEGTMRRRGLGVVPPGALRAALAAECVRFAIARREGRVVAAFWTLLLGKWGVWWANGYAPGEADANTLLLHDALVTAARWGAERFYLGATGSESVAVFKRSVGGVEGSYNRLVRSSRALEGARRLFWRLSSPFR